MKKSLFAIIIFHIVLASFSYVYPQVTIGSKNEPNVGALMDLKERQPTANDPDQTTSNRGLGLPRVPLTSLNELKPMYSYVGVANTPSVTDKDAHMGLMVYNTNESLCLAVPILKGLYIWDGSNWQMLTSGVSSDVQIFKDQEGNDFKARSFGDAGIWMIENLAVKSYSNNTAIDVFDSSTTNPAVKSMYAYPSRTLTGWSSQPTEWSRFQGLLYNWRAAVNNYAPNGNNYAQVQGLIPGANEIETLLENPAGAKNGKIQGVCPANWHLPSDREWNVLENVLYNFASVYSNYSIAEAGTFNPTTWQELWEYGTNGARSPVAGTTGHGAVLKSICSPIGVATPTGGKSLPSVKGGFDAMLVGNTNSAGSQNYGASGFFWTSSARAATTTWQRSISSSAVTVNRSVGSQNVLFSVRCKKD